jgi:hypothetical protein
MNVVRPKPPRESKHCLDKVRGFLWTNSIYIVVSGCFGIIWQFGVATLFYATNRDLSHNFGDWVSVAGLCVTAFTFVISSILIKPLVRRCRRLSFFASAVICFPLLCNLFYPTILLGYYASRELWTGTPVVEHPGVRLRDWFVQEDAVFISFAIPFAIGSSVVTVPLSVIQIWALARILQVNPFAFDFTQRGSGFPVEPLNRRKSEKDNLDESRERSNPDNETR